MPYSAVIEVAVMSILSLSLYFRGCDVRRSCFHKLHEKVGRDDSSLPSSPIFDGNDGDCPTPTLFTVHVCEID